MNIEEGDWVIVKGSELGYRIGQVEDIEKWGDDLDNRIVRINLGNDSVHFLAVGIVAVLAVKPEPVVPQDEPEIDSEPLLPQASAFAPERPCARTQAHLAHDHNRLGVACHCPGVPFVTTSIPVFAGKPCDRVVAHSPHDYMRARKRYHCRGLSPEDAS